ncbi:unnamed protein product [Cylindrotheca closterium]|uniref:START domain-containing protein n=1 Tax=Cylindrotheca closterium TaxID=2856 RepID=A0AAD2FRU1_9STRA|nr:unnamed protein product [Cylindrotheca closterium]
MTDSSKKSENGDSKPQIVSVAVGRKFQKSYGDGSSTPWLDDDPLLQQQIQKNQWIRWDGTQATAQQHMYWMKEQAQSFMSDERHGEYRRYAEHKGVEYFIHDELTKAGKGYGFFKLVGTFDFEPKDLVACMFDFDLTVEMDDTVILMKNLKTYYQNNKQEETNRVHNPFVNASYWSNAPGFPFLYRDGVDLSGYLVDDDTTSGDDDIGSTVWQLSMSIRAGDFQSCPYGLAAENRYWAYKLEPIREKGKVRTRTTLVCQTLLNGCIPKILSNHIVCKVLIDYVASADEVIKKNKKTGKHTELLKRLQLDDL